MIRLERRENGIAWVVFDRPEARNAMTFAMWERLRELAAELDADPAVRVVVFTGAGSQAFVSGTDIGEFRGVNGADDGIGYETRIAAVIAALEAIRVPTIAAIAGACTGGGLSIAVACDLRIGTTGTRIGVPIARTLGNCVSAGAIARIAAIVGLDTAKSLLLTARLLDATQAQRAGLLNEVVEPEQLAAHVAAIAEEIAALAPLTLRVTKELCRRLRDATPIPRSEDLMRICYGSADFQEGVAAFLDKRRPNWRGT